MTRKFITSWSFHSIECLHTQLTGSSQCIASLSWPRRHMKRCDLPYVITGQSAYLDSHKYAMIDSSWVRGPGSTLPKESWGCDIALIDPGCTTVTEHVCLLIKICSRRRSAPMIVIYLILRASSMCMLAICLGSESAEWGKKECGKFYYWYIHFFIYNVSI